MTDRHFIETQDFTKRELLDLIELIRIMKEARQAGGHAQAAEGHWYHLHPDGYRLCPTRAERRRRR